MQLSYDGKVASRTLVLQEPQKAQQIGRIENWSERYTLLCLLEIFRKGRKE